MLPALVSLALLAAPEAAANTLSAADQQAIFRLVCEGKLLRDRKGWVCKSPEAAESESYVEARLAELRWGRAIRGRFVAGDGEWLVGLHGLCIRGCSGEAHVVKKSAGKWTVLAQCEAYVDDGCIVVQGMADGFDRLVCSIAAGPHMGSMFEAIESVSFARGEQENQRLMQSELGGECFLPEAPPTARSREDQLGKPVPGDPGSQVAFTVALEIRTASCVEGSKEPDRSDGNFVLRFLKRGGAIEPDEETARVLREHDWAPALAGR